MKEGEKEETTWVQRVQGGETEAFENLILRYEKPIFNLLYRTLGNYEEAADVAQEVFIAAFRAIRKFRGESRFSTWLYRIAVNQAKNRLIRLTAIRKRQASSPSIDGEKPGGDNETLSTLPNPGPGPEELFDQKEIQAQVQEGLKQLKQDDSLLILLHDLQGLPYEEITQVLNIPLGTVKSRLHRARQALKGLLKPYYFSEKK